MSISKNLEPRIAELEMKLTFQETIIEELNQALIEQQFLIDKMQVQLRYLVNKLKDVQPLQTLPLRQKKTPPPHYYVKKGAIFSAQKKGFLIVVGIYFAKYASKSSLTANMFTTDKYLRHSCTAGNCTYTYIVAS